MAKFTAKQRFGPPPPSADATEVIVESRISGGMNTYLDPSDIENNQLVLLENAFVLGDKIGRANGTSVTVPTKPNSDPILLYTNFKKFDGTSIYYRFTKNKVYRQGSSSWTEVTSGAAYSISDNSRIRIAALNNRLFFTTGNAAIQEINTTANTYAALGNAGKYRYVTGFFNRLVGANLYDATNPNPTLIGWSGDINFGEWDPFVDPSAGSTPLLEAGTDFTDPITGLFGFAAVMLILRDRSLWTATKRPVASNPFSFQAAFPFVGCDTPDSAVQRRNGITWYDYRSNQVYSYTLGETPQEIGNPIRYEIKRRITDKSLVSAGYDPILNEYHLMVPSNSSNYSYVFTYSYEVGSWRQRILLNGYGVYGIDGATTSKTIDELTGVIDSLTGTIDSLGVITNTSPSSIAYGLRDGDILTESPSIDTDNGAEMTTKIQSKIFRSPINDFSISRVHFVINPLRAGSLTVYYSKDGGITWSTYKTATWTVDDVGVRRRISCIKHIRAKQFCWKIESTKGNFDFLEYAIEMEQAEFTKGYP